MDHVQANDNRTGRRCYYQHENNDGTGDVDIDTAEVNFPGNTTNAYGSDVYGTGNIIDLSNVTANSNGLGTFTDTTHGTGSVSVLVIASLAIYGSNTWAGLHIGGSGANVNLLNLNASRTMEQMEPM